MTSLLTGLVCFSWLGCLGNQLDLEIEDVTSHDAMTMVFVVYSYAISRLWVPNAFAFFFFVMVFCLSVSGIAALLLVVTTQVMDIFIDFKESLVSACACFFGFLMGIIYTCPVSIFLIYF